jgi:hypothetical protein
MYFYRVENMFPFIVKFMTHGEKCCMRLKKVVMENRLMVSRKCSRVELKSCSLILKNFNRFTQMFMGIKKYVHRFKKKYSY